MMMNPVEKLFHIEYNLPKQVRKWKRKKNHNQQANVIPMQTFGRYIDIIV